MVTDLARLRIEEGIRQIENGLKILLKQLTNRSGDDIMITESTGNGCLLSIIIRNNRLMWKSGGYFFLFITSIIKILGESDKQG